ncbi:MAG: GntR family transcriptional regulator [Pusillimonas sp.]
MTTTNKTKTAPKQTTLLKPAKTLADAVSARLTEEIVTGARPPGSRLDESSIAELFQVSRTPVREALRQLTASALVEWRPRQGAVVATISAHQMVAMFEIMAEYEGIAGRFAARRMSEEERKALVGHHERCRAHVTSKDREEYQRLNRPFHIAIYEGSHNSYLCAQATALYDRLAPYRTYELHRPGELTRVFDEHAAIVQAIVARDGALAYQLLKDHAMLDADLLGDLMAAVKDD